jgi:hypothetical protein
MNDVTLVSDLIIAMCEGIQSKKQVKFYYNKYENEFSYDEKLLENQFDKTIEVIEKIFSSGLKSTEFRRIHVFYTLFTSIFHTLYGLKNFDRDRKEISPADYPKARNKLEKVELLFQVDDVTQLDVSQIQFLTDSRRATTDTAVRKRRAEYVVDLLNSI